MIYWDEIELTEKGEKFIEDFRKTKLEKISEAIKSFLFEILIAIKEKTISFVAGIIVGVILSYFISFFI